jgi:hypothetical protein
MVKSVIIMALLASLFYLVKYSQPVAEPVVTGKVASSRPEKPPADAKGDKPAGFNPPVVAPLPDVNAGYVFSEKRKYEKDDPASAAKVAPVDQGPDPLTSLLYSGSLIAGNLRRALVTYQELPREADRSRPPTGRGPAPAPAQGATQNKQLNQGDRFLGYVVASIEPDRIVFEKGDRKVEKFLYDQGKKRMAPPASSPRAAMPTEIGGVPLQAIAPPEILAAMMAPPPSARRPTSGAGAVVSGPLSGVGPAGDAAGKNADAQAQSSRVVRRSQRLLGMESMINVPVTPVPGLPVPNQ